MSKAKEEAIVYHGSYKEVEWPAIRKQRYTRDFSWGFYCTEVKEQAEKWANVYNTPIVSSYRIKNTETLNIKVFDGYTDEWLKFVVSSRSGKTHSYDIVVGPMADDTIYEYIEAYQMGKINTQKIFEIMKTKHPITQISFHTIHALECIEFLSSYALPIVA